MEQINYLQYYDLEGYLFDVVSRRFAHGKKVTAFDFFCIVIWKANRAKSKVARRLLGHCKGQGIEATVNTLLTEIAGAEDSMRRLTVLIDGWGFRLPMASAILTVLYPEEFTVYDIRVCDVLDDFHGLENRTKVATLWDRYDDYIKAVKKAVPKNLSLRDKDRLLWGKSFAQQLKTDIESSFERRAVG